MRVPATWLIALAFMAGAITSVAGGDQDEALRLRLSGEIVPLERIIERARAQRAGTLVEAELEREHGRIVYELEFIGERGEHRKLWFDARTGEPIPKE